MKVINKISITHRIHAIDQSFTSHINITSHYITVHACTQSFTSHIRCVVRQRDNCPNPRSTKGTTATTRCIMKCNYQYSYSQSWLYSWYTLHSVEPRNYGVCSRWQNHWWNWHHTYSCVYKYHLSSSSQGELHNILTSRAATYMSHNYYNNYTTCYIIFFFAFLRC